MPTETATAPVSEKLSETEYLDQQAEAAKDAIAKTLTDIKNDLTSAIDPHRLTSDHPFVALGAAAIAGFAAAAVLVPSKEQQALKKLAALHRSLNEKVEEAKEKGSKAKDAGSSWWTMIVAELLKVLRPMLIGLITSNLGGGKPDEHEVDGNSDVPPDADDAPGAEAVGVSSPS